MYMYMYTYIDYTNGKKSKNTLVQLYTYMYKPTRLQYRVYFSRDLYFTNFKVMDAIREK